MIKTVGLVCLAIGGVQAYRIAKGKEVIAALDSYTGDKVHDQAARNVSAFLWMIRKCEGTAGVRGYNTIVGYSYFNDFSRHPNKYNKALNSTAAGAYQITYPTWLMCRANVAGLNDFSPPNQDKTAVWLLGRRGALGLVKSGNIEAAINGNGKRGNGARWEWASLPNSPYGQPKRTIAEAKSYYQSAGGVWV